MKTLQSISSHRQGSWQGQYNRMIRWSKKFNDFELKEKELETKTDDYFDALYACFQNIFFLKDWLCQETNLSSNELNNFINENKEIGICRDICNGTKHYNITNASVDKEFGIIRRYNPFHKTLNVPEFEIIICADGDIYEPSELILKSISLWDNFIAGKLKMDKKV